MICVPSATGMLPNLPFSKACGGPWQCGNSVVLFLSARGFVRRAGVDGAGRRYAGMREAGASPNTQGTRDVVDFVTPTNPVVRALPGVPRFRTGGGKGVGRSTKSTGAQGHQGIGISGFGENDRG